MYYIFSTSPNQKIVVTKKTVSDEENFYGKCNIEACMTAARVLTDRAFKLYIRMNLHQDGYTYALSPVAIENDTGMSDRRYRVAVQELIENGYLVQTERKNVYEFFENPLKPYQKQARGHKVDVSVHVSVEGK